MARYSTTHSTAAGTNLTIIELVASTATRGKLYEIIVSSDATPADIASKFRIIRGTVSGTGTALDEVPLDPAEPAAQLSAKGGTFTGQTKTANTTLLEFGLNQRSTFRWVAAPGGEITIPATSDNWVGLECVSSGGTPNVNVTFHWEE